MKGVKYMALGKNKPGDQSIPKSDQKHKHAKKADKDRSTRTEKPREEEKQAVGFQDSGTTRAQNTPD
jgi:hypothetical protein